MISIVLAAAVAATSPRPVDFTVERASIERRYGEGYVSTAGDETIATWSDLDATLAPKLHADGLRRIMLIRSGVHTVRRDEAAR